jgi:hypothetical protein
VAPGHPGAAKRLRPRLPAAAEGAAPACPAEVRAPQIYGEQRRDASAEELAASTAIDLGQVEALRRADAGTRSQQEPVTGLEGEIGTLGDLLEDPLSAER